MFGHSSVSPPPPRHTFTNANVAGFVRRVRATSSGNGWDHVYDLSYFFGFFVSGTIHWALHTAFPTPKQTGASPFEMELHRAGGDVGSIRGRPINGDARSMSCRSHEAMEVGGEKGGA